MNILPKKRWHVRTKDNIARVRRDEAAAREEERKREEQSKKAESEARINYLRQKSGLPPATSAQTAVTPDDTNLTQQHVDLFADFKSHVRTTNKELEKEKKEEKEKYEKQIGYLTYLGQDTNEALKLRSWYELAPKRANVDDPEIIEKDLNKKYSYDPLTLINALVPPEKKQLSASTKRVIQSKAESKAIETQVVEFVKSESSKQKKHKKLKKKKDHKKEKRHKREKERYKKSTIKTEDEQSKRKKIEELRKERLRREAKECARQEALFVTSKKEDVSKPKAPPTPRIVQKYNSQFNPELAKQNMQ